MEPVVDGLKKRYAGKVEVRVMNVDTDPEARDLAAKLGVTGVPEFYFFNSNGLQAGTIIGGASESDLAAVLDGLR